MCLNKAKKGYNNFKKVWEDRVRKREREQQQGVHNLIGRLLKRYIRNGGSS